MTDTGAVRRPGRGRPKRLVADKADASRGARQRNWRRGIRTTIPQKSSERRIGPFDRATDRQRTIVERLINHGKPLRRGATRYEQRAANNRAMITLAAILRWW